MNKITSHFIKTLILVSIIAINCNVFAQTADCDSPGDFSIVPVENVGGTGTVGDPYQICSNSLLTVQSNGVNPNLGFDNPGLVFIIYLCDPDDTNPDDDLFDGENGCFTALALAEADGSSYIVDNGTAIFNEAGIDWEVLSEDGLPINIIIVPVILEDITIGSSISYECSSIDLNGDYPHFVISDPSVNSDCSIDSSCEADAGSISEFSEFYCTETSISPSNDDFNSSDDYVQVYLLTDEALDILAVDTTTEFDLEETGAYLFHALNIAAEEAPSDLDALIDLNAQDVLSGLACFDLETSGLITVLEPLSISENSAACNDDDNTIIAEISISGGLPDYTISGDATGTADEDGLFTIEVDNTVEEVTLEVTDDAGCSSSITLSFSNLVCGTDCEADAGSISGLSEFYCTETSISPSNDGFNISDDYVQVYVLTDETFDILAVDIDAEFDLETGTYLFHALNIAAEEAPSDLDALIGLNAQDVLSGLVCFNLETSDPITVLEPLSISENSAACNDDDNTIIAEISISGGLSDYTISGDATGIADEDGLFTIEVDNTVEEVILEVTDDAGCSSSITLSFSNLVCGTDCEADAGSISGLSEFYCTETSISPSNDGFNSSDDYVQVYVLTDETFDILAVDTDAEFDLETGTYLFHALNIAAEEAPSDLDALIGLNAQDVLSGLVCFNLETSDPITVLEPLSISENSAACNDDDNTIIAEISISGGLPDYTISGDATGTADEDGLFTIEVDNTVEEVTLEVTDDAGCSSSITLSFSNLVCGTDCEADAGSISGLSEFYCTETSISPSNDGFNSSDDYVQVYVLTDETFDILAVDIDAEFDLETGAYLFHALNIAAAEAPSDLDALIGLNAQDVLSGLACFNLETSDLITILEPISISESQCVLADNTITSEISISGGLPNTTYTISGDVTGTADADGLFTIEVDDTVEEVILDVTDDAGCSASITISLSNCIGPDCEADAGLISGLSSFYCAATTISPTSVGFNSSDDYVQVYILTDEAFDILAVGTDAEFSLGSGAYLFHALNVAAAEAPSDLEALIGLNAVDVLSGLACFSLETSNLITVLEPIEYSIESIGCNDTSGLYDLVITITGGLPASDNISNYSLSGDLSESVDSDGLLAFSVEPSTTIEFTISDDEGCLLNAEYEVANCDPTDPCDDLASGSISTNSETTICTIGDDIVDVVVVELEGNQSSNFAYFITDADGLILDGPFDGPEFTFEGAPAGNCQIFGAAYEGTLDFTVGESVFDVSASECLALTNSIVITREICYDDITIGDPIFEVDESTGTYTITFGVFGGTGVYTGTNGTFDGNIFNSIEFNCGDSATIVITDDVGNTTTISFEAPCEAPVECPGDSEAGTLSVSATLLCANSVVTVGATGFNSGAEYTQLYIATTGTDYTIAALSEDGIFAGLASGVYQMHALNYYNSNAPTLPNIGESAANILNQTNTCFDLDVNDAITVTILNPQEAVIDYSCNPETGIYTLTFSFKGGLPQYVAENGSVGITGETIYTVSGDLNGSFIYGENIVVDYTENTSYSLNFFDAFGCEGSASDTPSACSKTAIELLVFDGEAKENGNLIYWATASEYNSDYFILEKSKDGVNWEQIKSKKAAINSNQSISYEYMDVRDVTGISYYRLISYDLDGQSEITQVVVVQNNRASFEVENIYPIPAQNNLSIDVYLPDYQEFKVEVYSLEGKMMKREIQLGDTGLNRINMDLSDFATGVYWIQVSSRMNSFSQKIIKAL